LRRLFAQGQGQSAKVDNKLLALATQDFVPQEHVDCTPLASVKKTGKFDRPFVVGTKFEKSPTGLGLTGP